MKKSKQKCECGSKSQERNCNSLQWHCDKKCNKFYDCELHRCEVKCHSGPCGYCPLGFPRSCPCGKEVSVLIVFIKIIFLRKVVVRLYRYRKRPAVRKSGHVEIHAKRHWAVAIIFVLNVVIKAIVVSAWKLSRKNAAADSTLKNSRVRKPMRAKWNANVCEIVISMHAIER